jgi:hypothetical protein
VTVVELPTNGSFDREAAKADAIAGMSRPALVAKYGISDGTAGNIRREAGVTGRGKEVTAEPVPKLLAPARATAASRPRPKPKTVADRNAIDWAIIGIVAAVGAIWSYSHIVDLAIAAGHGWRSYLLPIAIDGLVIAAIRAAGADRRKLVAWIGIVVGIVATVTFNVLAVRLELVDMDDVAAVLAAIPPIALAVTVHLVRR